MNLHRTFAVLAVFLSIVLPFAVSGSELSDLGEELERTSTVQESPAYHTTSLAVDAPLAQHAATLIPEPGCAAGLLMLGVILGTLGRRRKSA